MRVLEPRAHHLSGKQPRGGDRTRRARGGERDMPGQGGRFHGGRFGAKLAADHPGVPALPRQGEHSQRVSDWSRERFGPGLIRRNGVSDSACGSLIYSARCVCWPGGLVFRLLMVCMLL